VVAIQQQLHLLQHLKQMSVKSIQMLMAYSAADPRVVPAARKLKTVTYEEMLEHCGKWRKGSTSSLR
jgi:uridylate kinase